MRCKVAPLHSFPGRSGPLIGRVLIAAAVVGGAGELGAQDLPLVDHTTLARISAEVSGDVAYEHARILTTMHRPRGGSDGLLDVARYVEARAREYGLDDVALMKQAYGIRPWNMRFAELWVELNGRRRRLATTLETPLRLADNSGPSRLTAELLDVGRGTAPQDYRGVDVAGKVVLAHGPLTEVYRVAVGEHGAAGFIWYRTRTWNGR